jgi:nicotinamide-nucleotide amidase
VADERLAVAIATLRASIADNVYGEDGADLAAIVLDLLRQREWSIAVAESCTGGMLGMRLTATPGSSDVVLGGVIAYANAIKTRLLGVQDATLTAHGAVSDAVAAEMATGVRKATGAIVGVGITGVAGPGGATPAKPVGMVSVAVDANGVVETRTGQYVGDRDEVRRRATQAALVMVRRLALQAPGRTSGRPSP